MNRKPLFPIVCLLILGALLPAAGFAAAPQPTSDLLLPYFEVDTAGPGITTLLGVGNALDRPVDVLIALHTNWGLPVWKATLRFQPGEVKTFNLRDWLVLGNFPGARPGAAELAHIQAALAGQASPADGMYYGSSVAEDRAVGYVVLRTQGDRPDALWGDSFAVDVPQDFAQGDNLVDIKPARECGSGLCRRHALRFLSGGAFDGGTQLVVWTPRQIQPAPAAQLLAAEQLAVEASVYDEPGRRVDERLLLALPVSKISVADLGLVTPYGWLDLVTETESYVGVDYSADNAYALSLQATCLPIVVPPGPRIRIKKYTNGDDADEAPGPSIAVGGAVTWEYDVTNTGGVALVDVTVSDDKGVAVSCPKTALEPGESMTCTASGVAAACQYRNVGTAIGRTAEGDEVVDDDPSHYIGKHRAAIALVKSTNGQDANDAQGPKIEVGKPVAWTYLVTNSGAVRLTDVRVSDDDPGVAVSCPKTALQPGESMTCTANGVARLGQYRNVGTARGNPPCGPAVSDDDPSHYFGEGPPDPGIKIEKLTNGHDADAAPGPSIAVGSPVTWHYIVTNTGGVIASNLSVTDDQGVAVSCPKTVLQPGESMTCTGQGVAQACQYRNLGTVKGKTPTGAYLTASDPSHYFGQHYAAIRIVKSTNGQDANTAPGPTIQVGNPVQWTYVVTNSGDVALTGVLVSDDKGVAVSCPKTVLQPGESMTCTGSGAAVAGQYRNVGTARGTPPCGAVVYDDDPSHYYGDQPDPGLKILKLTNGEDANSAPGPVIPVGSPVTWQYIVTNTGGVALSNLGVTDDQGVAVSCPKAALQPGESMTCTGHGVAQSCQYRNLGTVKGKTPSGTYLTASDPSHYFGQHAAAIKIVKATNGQDANTAPGPTIAVGAPVQWTYVVTNTGDVALTGVAVSDDQGVAVSCPKTTLQPGESMTCTGSGVAVAGQYRNVGTVRGTPPCGAAVSDDDPSHYFAPPPPPPGGEGCTPGYWKNHEDSWPAAGYSTGQTVQSVFGQASNYPTLGSATLHQALSFDGGSTLEGAAGNLLRASVAALLNTAHPGVDYPRGTAAVIGDVNAALASFDRETMLGLAAALDRDNNLGCPLN